MNVFDTASDIVKFIEKTINDYEIVVLSVGGGEITIKLREVIKDDRYER